MIILSLFIIAYFAKAFCLNLSKKSKKTKKNWIKFKIIKKNRKMIEWCRLGRLLVLESVPLTHWPVICPAMITPKEKSTWKIIGDDFFFILFSLLWILFIVSCKIYLTCCIVKDVNLFVLIEIIVNNKRTYTYDKILKLFRASYPVTYLILFSFTL